MISHFINWEFDMYLSMSKQLSSTSSLTQPSFWIRSLDCVEVDFALGDDLVDERVRRGESLRLECRKRGELLRLDRSTQGDLVWLGRSKQAGLLRLDRSKRGDLLWLVGSEREELLWLREPFRLERCERGVKYEQNSRFLEEFKRGELLCWLERVRRVGTVGTNWVGRGEL